MAVELGDKVKCKVTGFQGIVTSVTFLLNGCRQVGIQAPLKKDGAFGENWNIDDSQIVILKKKIVDVKARQIGGPMKKLN